MKLWIALLSMLLAASVWADPFFPQGAPPADRIDVVELIDAPLDLKLAAITLQGVVNGGDRSEVYVNVRASDARWLTQLTDKGRIAGHSSLTPDRYFLKYAPRCAKVIVYDPDLPDSINIATMMASLEDAMVTAPGDAERFAPGKPVEDLRGRWDTPLEAYRWAYRELRPRMSRKVLASYHPTATHHFLRDYLIAAKVFHWWVTGVEKPGSILPGDDEQTAFLREVLAAEAPNTPIIGWWGGGKDHGLTEYGGVGMAGEYGMITVGNDWAPNLSMLSGVPADVDGAARRYRERARRPRPELDPGKVYICYNVVESGDSPAYLQDLQPGVWDDPQRGAIPINWCMGAAVLDLIPLVAEYYFDRAGPHDYLYLAMSGIGYTHPYRGLMSKTADPEAAWKGYLDLTGRFLRRMGCNEMGLYTDAWLPFDRAAKDPVTLRFADGIPELEMLVMGMGRDEGIDAGNGHYLLGAKPVLVSHILTRWPPDFAQKTREENIAWLVDEVRAQTPAVRPAFIQAMALSWAYRPADIVEVHRRLGDDYVPLTLPEFHALRGKSRD